MPVGRFFKESLFLLGVCKSVIFDFTILPETEDQTQLKLI